MLLLILLLLLWITFIPIDIFHLQLLPPISLGMSILGAIVLLGRYCITWTTLYQNAFAAPIVKDQSDLGQVLIDTALYESSGTPCNSDLCFS